MGKIMVTKPLIPRNTFIPEKQPAKVSFFLQLVIVVFLMSVLIFGNLQEAYQFFLGNLVFLIALMISLFYGYLGLVVTILVGCTGFAFHMDIWLKGNDSLSAAVIAVYLLNILASWIIARKVEKEKAKKKELEWLSITDGLTGLFNRRYFHIRLDQEIARAARQCEPLGLCMIDMDLLKQYNDTKGHAKGDEVIRHTAALIRDNVRKNDIVCRYGGDEFAVILPNSNAKEARIIMDRVQEVCHQQNILHDSFGLPNSLTLSIGFSIFPTTSGDKEQLISHADCALYLAKKRGRNRIERYQNVYEDIETEFNIAPEFTMNTLMNTVPGKEEYGFGHQEKLPTVH